MFYLNFIYHLFSTGVGFLLAFAFLLLKLYKKIIMQKKNGMAQEDEVIIGMKKEIAGQKVQIAKLENNIRAIKKKIESILFCIPNAKKFLIRRPLPAELLNELFASLPLENAFGILTKMPNDLLAWNVRKMIKSFAMAMKGNKWNSVDCEPKLVISEEGLVVKHSGPEGWNFVRAYFPIPMRHFNPKKPPIAYFEVEILKKSIWGGIAIGFCTQQFPLEGNWLGFEENSIGILAKGGIWIDGSRKRISFIDSNFQAGDVIGLGIVHSLANSPKMKCFATCNGKLLGMTNLPAKYAARLQFFPVVDLYDMDNSVRANFGNAEWLYNSERVFYYSRPIFVKFADLLTHIYSVIFRFCQFI